MQFVPFHIEYKILIWVKECSESTLRREHYIEIGQIRDMETSVSNGLFLLYLRNFLKLGQVVLTEYGKPGKPVWNNYSEKTESPDNPFTISPNVTLDIVSLFRSSSILGILSEANMPFEIRHI